MPRKNYFEGGLELESKSSAPTGRSVGDAYLDDGTNTGSGNPGWRYLASTGPDVWADVSPGGGVDTTAIHKATADEFDTASLKGAPVSDDRLLIEDSADSLNKKYATVGSLPSGSGGGETVAALDSPVTMGATAAEFVVGQTTYDGSSGASHTFKAVVEPDAAVTSEIRLYDRGPVAGPPVAAQLVSKLTTSTAGLQVLSLTLTANGSPSFPDNDEIYNADRMYEVRAYISGSEDDTLYVGKVTLEVV